MNRTIIVLALLAVFLAIPVYAVDVYFPGQNVTKCLTLQIPDDYVGKKADTNFYDGNGYVLKEVRVIYRAKKTYPPTGQFAPLHREVKDLPYLAKVYQWCYTLRIPENITEAEKYEGRYVMYYTIIAINYTYDSRAEEWKYNFTKIAEDKYAFEVEVPKPIPIENIINKILATIFEFLRNLFK